MSSDAKYFAFLRSELDWCRIKNDQLAYDLGWRLKLMAEHFISGGMIAFPDWCIVK